MTKPGTKILLLPSKHTLTCTLILYSQYMRVSKACMSEVALHLQSMCMSAWSSKHKCSD